MRIEASGSGSFFIWIISFGANAITSYIYMYVLRTYVYIIHNNIMSHSIIRSAGTVLDTVVSVTVKLYFTMTLINSHCELV